MQKKKIYLELIGRGHNRIVFRRKNNVIKIPLNDYGRYNNTTERRRFLESKKSGYIPYARCRLAGFILIMEYIEPTSDYKNLPRWSDFVDCQQVGYDKNHCLVAYDYA